MFIVLLRRRLASYGELGPALSALKDGIHRSAATRRLLTSKSDESLFPNISWNGPVKVLQNAKGMNKALAEILESGESHFGFDVEFVAGKGNQNVPVLVQIATETSVYLFRLCKLSGQGCKPLLPLLTNEKVVKTGIGIKQDVERLQELQKFDAAGFVDIAAVTREHLNFKNNSLNSLAQHFLKKSLKKRPPKSGNWASEKLTESQINYAATDAWVSREIYKQAVRNLEPSNRHHLNPRKPYHCSVCNGSFMSNSALNQHQQAVQHFDRVEIPKAFLCSACDRVFGSEDALNQHQKAAGANHYKCPGCNRKFGSAQALGEHQKALQHYKSTKSATPPTKVQFTCFSCSQKFSSEDALNQHKKALNHSKTTAVGKKDYKCPRCDRKFVSAQSLAEHQKALHLYEQPVKSAKQFECSLCSKKFGSATALKQHQKALDHYHVGCSTCGRKFKDQASLDQHRNALSHS